LVFLRAKTTLQDSNADSKKMKRYPFSWI